MFAHKLTLGPRLNEEQRVSPNRYPDTDQIPINVVSSNPFSNFSKTVKVRVNKTVVEAKDNVFLSNYVGKETSDNEDPKEIDKPLTLGELHETDDDLA